MHAQAILIIHCIGKVWSGLVYQCNRISKIKANVYNQSLYLQKVTLLDIKKTLDLPTPKWEEGNSFCEYTKIHIARHLSLHCFNFINLVVNKIKCNFQ